MHVERELQELRDRLAQVEGWKRRREEIDQELAQVWVVESTTSGSGETLEPPSYVDVEKEKEREMQMQMEKETEKEAVAETEAGNEADAEVKPVEVGTVDSK